MEFQVDCCSNAEEANVYMNSKTFAANPVGVEVSFDSLLAQYRKGVAPATLFSSQTDHQRRYQSLMVYDCHAMKSVPPHNRNCVKTAQETTGLSGGGSSSLLLATLESDYKLVC
jgi:hypothetical protein